MQTKKAIEVYPQNKQEQCDLRKETIVLYIRDHPNESAYSISKDLNIPCSSLISLLEELEDELEIKSTKIKEQKRREKNLSSDNSF